MDKDAVKELLKALNITKENVDSPETHGKIQNLPKETKRELSESIVKQLNLKGVTVNTDNDTIESAIPIAVNVTQDNVVEINLQLPGRCCSHDMKFIEDGVIDIAKKIAEHHLGGETTDTKVTRVGGSELPTGLSVKDLLKKGIQLGKAKSPKDGYDA